MSFKIKREYSQSKIRGSAVTAARALLALIVVIAFFASLQAAEAGQWGTVKNVTIVANSTGNVGHKGLLTTDGTSLIQVLATEISSQTQLTNAELNSLSSLDGATSYASSTGSAGNDEYVRLNITLSGVASVNYVVVKTQMRTLNGARDALRFGVYNYSTARWIRLNETAATSTFTTFTYNISSATEKNAYLSLSNGVLSISLLAWGVGTSSDTVDVSFFEANVNYNEAAELSGYVKDNYTGLPISDVKVTTNTSLTTTTNASGFYKFTVVNRSYIINASKPGYYNNFTTATVSGADSLNNNISLSPNYTGGGRIAVFTDKKVYKDFYIQHGRMSSNIPARTALETDNFVVYAYAMVLDENGKPMKNLPNQITGILDDTQKLDHYDKGDLSYHHAIDYNSNYFYADLLFNDTGQYGDGIAGDGIYTAYVDLPDATDAIADEIVDDHIRINVSAAYGRLIAYTDVLYSAQACHNGETENHQQHTADDLSPGSNSGSPCTMCHRGYEHFYENQSGTFPNSMLDVHFQKIQPAYTVQRGSEAISIIWNLSKTGGTAWGGSSANWEQNMPGSSYCYICHYAAQLGPILDYDDDATGRLNLADKPSCGVATKTLNGVTGAITCHATTEISGAPVVNWTQSAAAAGNHISLNDTWKAKSHNHTNTSVNVSCALCHGSIHQFSLPNSSATGTAYRNISNQCYICHSDTGPKTSPKFAHSGSTTNCTLCHYNSTTSKLDAHLVPKGIVGGVNCTSCHNIGGSATNHIVNFTSINRSMHGNLNKNASSSSGNVSNKPCWACHGTKSGIYANESDQPLSSHNETVFQNPRKCYDCHNDSWSQFTAKSITDHIPSGMSANTDVNTSSYNNGYCSLCHNNSIGTSLDPDGSGLAGGSAINASVSHYGANKTANKLMSPTNNSTDCVYCHRNSSNMLAWGILSNTLANISNKNTTGGGTNHNSYPASSQCAACHGGYTVTAGFTFHDPALGSGSVGGRNCTSCHDIGKSNAMVDVGRMNQTSSIHNYLNLNGTASDPDNKRCWACHSNSSVSSDGRVDQSELPESGHPDGFDTPKNCTLCHIDDRFGARIVSEHFTSGSQIRTKPYSSINVSCVSCHNKTEMLLSNNDPGGVKSIYASVSHYGDNKTSNTTYVTGGSANCTYCHSNANAFTSEMVNSSWNASIKNHTGLGTNPGCTNITCHDSGRIHFSGLARPQVTTSLCNSCHATKSKHNDSIECSRCHLETNQSIHPVQYLQPGNIWKINSPSNRSSAVNCTDCHQGVLIGFESAPLIPSILKHSSNSTNGSIWGTYWNSTQESSSSCYYCHNDTKHNSTALGRILNLLAPADPNNTRNGTLTITTWCADCHLNTSNTNYKGSLWPKEPPLITVNNTIKSSWINHSGYVSTGYKDNNCKSCHALNGTYLATSLNYSHTLDEGVAPGPNCISCHNLVTGLKNGATAGINFTAANASVHFGMNSVNATNRGYAAIVGACWACHDTDGNVSSGHPDRKATPKICDECHLGAGIINASAYNAMVVSEHFYGGSEILAGNSTSTIASCINCHENVSEMILYNNDTDFGSFAGDGLRLSGGNMSYYHYGNPRKDMRTGTRSRESNCLYCHQNTSTMFAIGMQNPGLSKYIYNHTDAASQKCANCHGFSWLHNSTLTIPGPFDNDYCINCHTGGTANTRPISYTHYGNGLDCWNCHQDPNGTMYQSPIHGMMYPQANGSYERYIKGTPANCTTCHVYNLVNTTPYSATRMPSINHSTDTYSGKKWGNYWDNKSMMTACHYCHQSEIHNTNSQLLGNISTYIQGSNSFNNPDLAASTWCANCHYASALEYGGNNLNPVPPEITNSSLVASDGTPFFDHSWLANYNDSQCQDCHGAALAGYSETTLNFSHSVSEGLNGGPNCTNCHNAGKSSPSPGGLVNFSAMNDSGAIHKNMNKDAPASDPNYSENKKCWACHGNGSEPVEHPSNYKVPYNCTACHLQGAGQNMNYTPANILNVSQHFWNGNSIKTAAVTSCYGCHNMTEMMSGNVDPDGPGNNVYSGANGGNNSSSHYGRKRTDLHTWDSGNSVNCSYCHVNTTTAFETAMLNPSYNESIGNHSQSNSPGCTNSTCHGSGWMHNSTLARPPLPLPNTTYCQDCHSQKEEHNGTQQCSKCHIDNTSSDTIHPIKYVQKVSGFETTKTNAANCTDCHQAGLVNFSAPIIPGTLKHSSNPRNGSLWNMTSTPFWTSEEGSCYYCHDDTKHNYSSALGRINDLTSDTNNTKKGTLTTTTWCVDCHYNDSANSKYKGNQWVPEPPLITLDNTGKSGWMNHSGYLGAGYKDENCKTCHALNGMYQATSLNYTHSLDQGVTGGRNCTSCHDIGQSTPRVDVSKMNTSGSIHNYLNSLATASNQDNKRCWACHTNNSVSSDGVVNEAELPESGHPDGFDAPRNCTLCHMQGNFSALIVSEHNSAGTNLKTKPYSNTNDSCVNCHNKSEMLIANNDPAGPKSIYASVSHYGSNKTGVGNYISGGSANCTYCHSGPSAFQTEMVDPALNSSISNHTGLGTNPGCTTCHNTGRIHDPALDKPTVNTTLCTTCHVEKSRHNNSVECSRCHLQTNRSIHPVQYLQPGNIWKINSPSNRSSAVNCTNCHQGILTGFESAPIIPSILKHSSNSTNGSIWGTYWNTSQPSSSCYYCHADTKHNYVSALGRINNLTSDPNNTRNGALTTTTWCVDCHYNGSSNSRYKGNEWNPQPPLITVNNTGKSGWENHSDYVKGGYKDSSCKTCHGLNGTSYLETSLNYSHSFDTGVGGGPDCVSSGCHGSTGSPSSPFMNWTSLKSGMHAKLNNGTGQTSGMTDPIVEACWACHGDGTKPGGHPANYKQPYYCTSCHLSGKFNAKNVTQHQHVNAMVRTNSTYARCENCHNNSLVDYFDNEINALTNYTIGNVSHYGANKTAGKLMEPSVNSTDCVYCHLNNSNRLKWANATNASATKPDIHGSYNATTSSSQCWTCHVDGGISSVKPGFTLHNASLNPGASEYCLNCHVEGGSAQNVNVSSIDLGMHVNLNSSGGSGTLSNGDCWVCHFGYPQPSGGSHSYNVNRQNTYYCEDCHGPNKNRTAIPNATTTVLAEFYHGKSYDDTSPRFKDCTICHAPNNIRRDSNGNRLKVYHNKTPLGKVANTGWAGWNAGTVAGCNDCHQTHNGNDAPFYAPGKEHYVGPSGGCSSNCHDGGNIHMQNLFGDLADLFGITPPEIRAITINNNVIAGDYVNFTARGMDNYNQIEAGQYRVVNSGGGEIIGWTNMTTESGKFRSRVETLRGSIDTTDLAAGNYTVYIKVMASGPRADQTKRAYPLNGAWSGIYSTVFTVLGG